MQEQAQAGQATDAGAEAAQDAGGPDDAVDAEFEEMKDDNK